MQQCAVFCGDQTRFLGPGNYSISNLFCGDKTRCLDRKIAAHQLVFRQQNQVFRTVKLRHFQCVCAAKTRFLGPGNHSISGRILLQPNRMFLSMNVCNQQTPADMLADSMLVCVRQTIEETGELLLPVILSMIPQLRAKFSSRRKADSSVSLHPRRLRHITCQW